MGIAVVVAEAGTDINKTTRTPPRTLVRIRTIIIIGKTIISSSRIINTKIRGTVVTITREIIRGIVEEDEAVEGFRAAGINTIIATTGSIATIRKL